jgi:hypothetical protein
MLASDQPKLRGGMSLFEITPLGFPYAVAGVIYLMTAGHRLLRNARSSSSNWANRAANT